jgi:hypothetical protein
MPATCLTPAPSLVQESHIEELVGRLDTVLVTPSTTMADVVSLQREAASMPDWASYKASMEMGFRLGARQR